MGCKYLFYMTFTWKKQVFYFKLPSHAFHAALIWLGEYLHCIYVIYRPYATGLAYGKQITFHMLYLGLVLFIPLCEAFVKQLEFECWAVFIYYTAFQRKYKLQFKSIYFLRNIVKQIHLIFLLMSDLKEKSVNKNTRNSANSCYAISLLLTFILQSFHAVVFFLVACLQ